MHVKTDWQTVHADGTAMRLFVARPESKAKVPGLLVLQEAFGVNDHIRNVTMRLAALGFVAVAPELYHRTAPGFEGAYHEVQATASHRQVLTEAALTADLRAAYDWLCADTGTDGERTGAIGYCFGGRVAWLANAALPLKAAVSYYGGQIAPALLPRASEQHGPILLFWGGKDAHIDLAQRRAVSDALRQAKKPFIEVEFSEADHGFFCEARASYHLPSAGESWALVQAFFAEHFAPTP